MREDNNFTPETENDIDTTYITGNVSTIITWPFKRKKHDDEVILDDEIIYEEVVADVPTHLDKFGRPYTSFPATDRDGRPMTVECHTASDGSHYTVEHRVSADGVPHSIQYPGDWKGEAWKFDPSTIPEPMREEMGRGFLDLYLKFMQELEKDPARKAEFEAGVEEVRKREKHRKKRKK